MITILAAIAGMCVPLAVENIGDDSLGIAGLELMIAITALFLANILEINLKEETKEN